MEKIYRKGAVGALMDEYERAVIELKDILQKVSEDEFLKIKDLKTRNENCRSIQTIVNHVIRSGHFYADGIRRKFAISEIELTQVSFKRDEAMNELDDLIEYTAQTLENHWEMPDKQILATFIETNLEFTENLEQILEHAIVHVLRHRRQIEKFTANGDFN